MKFNLKTMLTVFFMSIAIVSTAAIGEGPNAHTPALRSRQLVQQGKIVVELGVNKVKVGTTLEGNLYHLVYISLKKACSDPSAKECIKYKAAFPIASKNEKGDLVFGEVTIDVESFNWHSNIEMYNLLIGSVAGAVERAAFGDNCSQVGGSSVCNTTDRVAVGVEGGAHIRVALYGTRHWGDFDCSKIVETAGAYVDTLRKEYQTVTGHQQLRVDSSCKA